VVDDMISNFLDKYQKKAKITSQFQEILKKKKKRKEKEKKKKKKRKKKKRKSEDNVAPNFKRNFKEISRDSGGYLRIPY
jgi:hypothetical protein